MLCLIIQAFTKPNDHECHIEQHKVNIEKLSSSSYLTQSTIEDIFIMNHFDI